MDFCPSLSVQLMSLSLWCQSAISLAASSRFQHLCLFPGWLFTSAAINVGARYQPFPNIRLLRLTWLDLLCPRDQRVFQHHKRKLASVLSLFMAQLICNFSDYCKTIFWTIQTCWAVVRASCFYHCLRFVILFELAPWWSRSGFEPKKI